MNLKISSARYVCLTVSIVTILSIFNPIWAQTNPNATVTINPKTLKLKEVFEQLSQKAGLNFIYSNFDKELERTITLVPASSTIKNILEQLSAKTGLKFSANGDDIAVKLQSRGSIKGSVKTAGQEGAANVTVKIKGLRTTETDREGYFTFKNVPAGHYSISVSHIGHSAQSQQVIVAPDETTIANFIISAGATDLNEVTVNGNKANRFTEKQSSTVAKMSLKTLENPQVYSSVTKELIKDQIIVTYSDILKNVPGVALQLPNQQGDVGGSMTSRGFITATKLRNGVPGNTTGMLDPINLETIEAIKGPSGALFGNSLVSFGGLFNLVTKKPYEDLGGEVSYSTGSLGLNRFTADINTPLNKEKTLLFRITGAKHHEDSFQDAGFRSYTFVAPSLTYAVNEKLTFNLDAEFINGKYNDVYRFWPDNSYKTGVQSPKDLKVDFNRRWVDNDLFYSGKSSNFYAQANYQISTSWKSQTNFSSSNYKETGPWAWIQALPGNEKVSMNFIFNDYLEDNMIDLQQNFIGETVVAGLRNRLLVGLDYYYNYGKNSNYYLALPGINMMNPGADYNTISKLALENHLQGDNTRNKTSSSTYSAYIQDVIDLPANFSVLLSLRFDRFENKGIMDLSTRLVDGDYKQNAFSPKFGLVYQPIKGKVSLFANYLNGFKNLAPASQPDGSTSIFKPQQANQYEGGVKLDLLSGRLTSTISYYHIQVDNTVRNDPDRPGLNGSNFKIQDGSQVNKGFEADLNFNPADGLNIIAGYGYNDSKRVKANANVDGLRADDAGPKKLINAWVTYNFTHGDLKGFGAGFGGNYADENYIRLSTTSKFVLPSYTVLNASVFLDRTNYRLGLKVNNLTNKEYFTGWASFVPQMPRSFIVDFSLKFGKVK